MTHWLLEFNLVYILALAYYIKGVPEIGTDDPESAGLHITPRQQSD
jgi:hypothetical protein